jgi:hypothetical protein
VVHFHAWRAARDRKAATRRLWRSRSSGLVTVPLSIGLATLVLAARHVNPFCTRRLTVAQKLGTGC